jgi:hypothetical protein
MTAEGHTFPARAFFVLFAISVITITGCASGSYASKGAAKGAKTGAVAGAVGGMVTALVFGGDVVEAGARGAVYGGTTGAVVGGMAGSDADKAALKQQEAERDAQLAQLKESIGADAYSGIEALTDCKHEVAIANAREASNSSNSDYALAGIWVEVLAEADRQRVPQARTLFPELIKYDPEIDTEADAEMLLNQALKELQAIRVEYDLPATCGTTGASH